MGYFHFYPEISALTRLLLHRTLRPTLRHMQRSENHLENNSDLPSENIKIRTVRADLIPRNERLARHMRVDEKVTDRSEDERTGIKK